MKRIKSYLPLILLVLCSVVAWMLGLQKYFNLEAIQENQKALSEFIYTYYTASIFIFSAIYILVVALSIPGASIMTISSGFFFGQAVGAVLAVISATLGATLFFLSTRLASEDILQKKAGPWMKKMQAGFQENAFSYLLTLRLIPLFPFVAINLVTSLLQIPLRTFFFGTLLGIIPGSFVYASMGVALREVIQQPGLSPNLILDPHILIALGGLGLLSLLPIAYKKYKELRRK